AMGLHPKIEFFDMPENLRDRYQYFTEAKIEKLRKSGYQNDFYSLEEGIKDYVQNYLMKGFAHY
ncbi:MAG TPA: ADP-L-glycero-D-mannoheptose-6-epimerase, partial [Caldithrix abyssi]|nr:ADP-L-glycero-D-mannoheptose-6-epimerase [Caldithrix abyssi]